MSAAAQPFVDAFDFNAARRFIEARARQVRREIRTYAVAIGVLVVAGAAQHVLRHPGAIGAFDKTDLAFGVVLAVSLVCAAGRLRVLGGLARPARDLDATLLRRATGREAARVRRERVFGAAAVVVATAALAMMFIDAVVDRSWGFAAGFAALAVFSFLSIRRFIGARSRQNVERYIAGEIGDPHDSSDPTDDRP